jgi:hypothetical protein
MALVGCAPHHVMHKGPNVPTWKFAADFAALTVGGAVCVTSQDYATRALGCGTTLMVFLPYWLIPGP